MVETYAPTTRATGTNITAAIWNGDHGLHATYQVHGLTHNPAEDTVSEPIAIDSVDALYQIVGLIPTWNTTVRVVSKETGSVTVQYSTPAPAGQSLDVSWRRDA